MFTIEQMGTLLTNMKEHERSASEKETQPGFSSNSRQAIVTYDTEDQRCNRLTASEARVCCRTPHERLRHAQRLSVRERTRALGKDSRGGFDGSNQLRWFANTAAMQTKNWAQAARTHESGRSPSPRPTTAYESPGSDFHCLPAVVYRPSGRSRSLIDGWLRSDENKTCV